MEAAVLYSGIKKLILFYILESQTKPATAKVYHWSSHGVSSLPTSWNSITKYFWELHESWIHPKLVSGSATRQRDSWRNRHREKISQQHLSQLQVFPRESNSLPLFSRLDNHRCTSWCCDTGRFVQPLLSVLTRGERLQRKTLLLQQWKLSVSFVFEAPPPPSRTSACQFYPFWWRTWMALRP